MSAELLDALFPARKIVVNARCWQRAEETQRASGRAVRFHVAREERFVYVAPVNTKKYRPFPQYLPADGQVCNIVRYVEGGTAIEATFSATTWSFISTLTEWKINAWDVVEWRPTTG